MWPASLAGTNPASATAEYFLHDQLGSTRALYNASKVQQASFSYAPFGELYASTNASLATHRYTGHDFDPASGLYYAPYRYLSPSAARWIGRDPAGMVDGPNLYAYVMGWPLGSTDPNGQSATIAIGVWGGWEFGGAILTTVTLPGWIGPALVAGAIVGTGVGIYWIWAQHTKGARPSTKNDHEYSEARKKKQAGGDKK